MPPVSPRNRKSKKSARLLDSLEQRLDLLTSTLGEAEVAGKSIDIVKEIKELHAILRSLREKDAPEAPPKIMVVWGGPASSSSGKGSNTEKGVAS